MLKTRRWDDGFIVLIVGVLTEALSCAYYYGPHFLSNQETNVKIFLITAFSSGFVFAEIWRRQRDPSSIKNHHILIASAVVGFCTALCLHLIALVVLWQLL